MPCYSPLKGWRNAETGGWQGRASGADMEMEVACGQCLGCRLDRSRMWAMRIVHEASLYQHSTGNSFITLTYRNPIECNKDQLARGLHVPDDWSLHKSHFVKFMKRLRSHRNGEKIRYFMCGEYGRVCRHGLDVDEVSCEVCNFGRPHYHAILFNCSFCDLVKYNIVNGEGRYYSPSLEKIWRYGFVDVGEVNFESAAYVARYALKKKTGQMAEEWYFDPENGDFKQPEYCTMSRKPGIGKKWYDKYKSDMFPSDDVPVPGQGVLKGMPRYYETLFGDEDPLTLEAIKEVRRKFKEDHADEYTPERLHSKYRVKQKQIELLKRTVS